MIWRSKSLKSISEEEEVVLNKVMEEINKDGNGGDKLIDSFRIREAGTNVLLGEFKKDQDKFIIYIKGNRKIFGYKIESLCRCFREICSLNISEERVYLTYL